MCEKYDALPKSLEELMQRCISAEDPYSGIHLAELISGYEMGDWRILDTWITDNFDWLKDLMIPSHADRRGISYAVCGFQYFAAGADTPYPFLKQILDDKACR